MLRILIGRKCVAYALIRQHVRGRVGLEIGGPSFVFSRWGIIPIYGLAARLDACDYAMQTVWNSQQPLPTKMVYRNARFGFQVVCEAGRRLALRAGVYDFVLASHVLEHCANPLMAITEWKRVLRPDGVMLLLVPRKEAIFDHRRPYTAFAHLEKDFREGVDEDDLTHLEEIIALHDLSLDPHAGSWPQFRERGLRNAENRCLHHHVFSPELLIEACIWAKMAVLSVSVERPNHIIVFAAKAANDRLEADNRRFLELDAEWRRRFWEPTTAHS